MLEFAMAHEIITLIIVLCFLETVRRVVIAFVNRNKPVLSCKAGDDKSTVEVVSMGGEEED